MPGDLLTSTQPILDAMVAHIAVVDRAGDIVLTNRAWKQFAAANGGIDAKLGIGANYLKACQTASDDLSGISAHHGIQRVLAAEIDLFEMEYPCHAPSELRWFIMQVTPLAGSENTFALIVHQEVTRLRIAWTDRETEQVQASQHASSVQELESLEALSRGAPTTLTARSFGLVRLSEGMPALFGELVDRYTAVLDLALEQRTYKVKHPISAELRIIAERLGFARSGPRDIIDIHTAALRTKLKHGPKITHAYFEESRVLLLELMGYLVSYYRTYATGPGAPVSNASVSAADASD